MENYLTSGQVCRKLRISMSTLKRWLSAPELQIPEQRNYNGWRLFSDSDVETLKEHKQNIKKKGKRFKKTIFIQVIKEQK